MGLKKVVEKVPGYNSLVRPLHFAQAMKASVKCDFPAKKLRVIAVTGTNGKTTTCFMIWKMLNAAGRKAGLLTTVAWGGVNGDENDIAEDGMDARHLHKQFEHMTTERVEILNERIRAVAKAKAEFLVLEVTSHALTQSRILCVPIEIAVFTNLAHEHLDYHKTFEKYRAAKLKLFKKSKFGVVNADDANANFFVKQYADGDIYTYGIEAGDLRATDIALGVCGVQYLCGDISKDGNMQKVNNGLRIRTQIPGKFNVYNSLAAVAVGRKVGLTEKQIASGIFALTEVEGRMTRIREGQDFEVFVDYAHVPDALEKVFDAVKRREIRKTGIALEGGRKIESKSGQGGKVIAVHGGAGRRDASTRAERGKILGRESDIVIITEDDSRDEDPKMIAAQFVEGAERAGKVLDKDLFVELDREKAIRKAIGMARKGDLVLILGKGHEKTILRADGVYPFEDIKVTKKALRERLKKTIK